MARRGRALKDQLLRGPLGLGLVVALFVGLALQGVADDRYLHDEGLLTHLFAWSTANDPWATLFLQKSRPPISASYAPFAAYSLDAFFVAHVVVAAAGVVFLGLAGRALGHRAPVLTASVLALSPLYISGAAAGVSNTDVVAGLCLFLWLQASQRHLAAAAVLGVLPWIRAEVIVLLPLVAFAPLRKRELRVLAAFAAFGLAYGLVGSIYHRDALWMLHYPPALPSPMPDNPFWTSREGTASLSDLVTTAVALTPLVPALALVRPARLAPLERLSLSFMVMFVVALVLLPVLRVFNFDQSPRYLLPVVPCVALAVGRSWGRWGEGHDDAQPLRWALVALGALAGLAVAGALEARHATGLAAVGVVAGVLASVRAGHVKLAAVVVGALVVLGPVGFGDGGRMQRRHNVPHLDPMVDRLEEVVGTRPRVIYTNEPLLASYLRRSGRLPNVSIMYIVQEDQRFELESLANPHVGQREALWKAMRGNAYGRAIKPEALRPDSVPANALFALTKDPRLEMVMPEAVWGDALEVIHPGYRMMIAQRVQERRR